MQPARNNTINLLPFSTHKYGGFQMLSRFRCSTFSSMSSYSIFALVVAFCHLAIAKENVSFVCLETSRQLGMPLNAFMRVFWMSGRAWTLISIFLLVIWISLQSSAEMFFHDITQFNASHTHNADTKRQSVISFKMPTFQLTTNCVQNWTIHSNCFYYFNFNSPFDFEMCMNQPDNSDGFFVIWVFE